ncbi:hypothetical protein V3C99_014264, partial [Haemonchus contortus]
PPFCAFKLSSSFIPIAGSRMVVQNCAVDSPDDIRLISLVMVGTVCSILIVVDGIVPLSRLLSRDIHVSPSQVSVGGGERNTRRSKSVTPKSDNFAKSPATS